MNIYKDFQNPEIIEKLVNKIQLYKGNPIKIMEVCGSHTNAIGKYGIRSILPENIKLISGPGCPVCVTDTLYMDIAIKLSKRDNFIVASFGDLIKVKGSKEKLNNVRVVLSPFECLKIAKENPNKEVVFLSVGFETTTPITALTIKKAKELGINNLSFLVSNKTMPNILKYLMANKVDVNGFLFPGHVATITGCEFYRDFCHEYNLKGVITGFEPIDILGAIVYILYGKDNFKNLYTRFVSDKGNIESQNMVDEIFEENSAYLREIGLVEGAGLKIRKEFEIFDANVKFNLNYNPINIPKQKGCKCGEILLGKKSPIDCPFFGKQCTPNEAIGPCMVSEEGSCASFYKYFLN